MRRGYFTTYAQVTGVLRCKLQVEVPSRRLERMQAHEQIRDGAALVSTCALCPEFVSYNVRSPAI